MTPIINATRTAIILLLSVFVHPSLTLYNEQINSKQLDQLFVDDDCVEGTLANIQAAWPSFRQFDMNGGVMISKEINETQNEFLNIEGNGNIKSPLSLVSELAQFNRVIVHYNVIDEKGPAHNKRFLVRLKLGDEEYEAEGNSIKLAQREAARLALNSTFLEHPPLAEKQNKQEKVVKTSVEKLSEWVSKRINVKIRYYYFEETKYKPTLNDYFHSKPETIYKVVVRINEKDFTGDGLSIFAAKENAASLALNNLKNLDGLCPFNNNEAGVLAKLFGYDLESESPVSLINEFGSRSSIQTSFSLHQEEGPAHMKHFVYKCIVGDHVTFGDGSNKKEAKREAAKKMVEVLKTKALHSAENCSKVFKKNKRNKKKKSKNLTKSFKPKPSYLEEEDSEVSNPYETPMNPISKLYQIQQRSGLEPIFQIIEGKDGTNKEFTVQVLVGDLSSIGTGFNKKTAKRKAAEEMLKMLGYQSDTNKQRLTNVEEKKKEFILSNNLDNVNIKPNSDLKISKVRKNVVTDGLSSSNGASKKLMSDNVDKNVEGGSKPAGDSQKHSKSSRSTSVQPMQDLKSLAKQLGVKFEFYDFPKQDKLGFVSLLSLTTNPPKVCKGSGDTVERSQEKAALSALENLYKTQLESISNILGKTVEFEEKPMKTFEMPVYLEKE